MKKEYVKQMKPYFIEPDRLKSLLKSAEEQLGLRPKEAQRHVTEYLKDEAIRYARNPTGVFNTRSFVIHARTHVQWSGVQIYNQFTMRTKNHVPTPQPEQELHALAPASDVVPLGHEMQPLAPLVALYMPLGHGRHAVPPTTIEYVPGLH